MFANITNINDCFEIKMEIIKAFSFVPFGLLASIANGILFIAIIRSRTLRRRQELIVVAALAFADFAEAFATLLGGLYRLTIIFFDLKDVIFTGLQCMLLPHSWIWRWSDFATSFMLLTVTLDRLISVSFPLKYIFMNKKYPFTAVLLPYATSLFLSATAWIQPFELEDDLSMICMNVYISASFYSMSKYLTSIATALSIVLYIPVIIIARSQIKSMLNKVRVTRVDQRRKAQLKMTITIAINSFCTLFLDCIPRAIGIYGTAKAMTETTEQCESPMMMFFHLTKLNSVLGVYMFYKRNEMIRQSIRAIFGIRKEATNVATINNEDLQTVAFESKMQR